MPETDRRMLHNPAEKYHGSMGPIGIKPAAGRPAGRPAGRGPAGSATQFGGLCNLHHFGDKIKHIWFGRSHIYIYIYTYVITVRDHLFLIDWPCLKLFLLTKCVFVALWPPCLRMWKPHFLDRAGQHADKVAGIIYDIETITQPRGSLAGAAGLLTSFEPVSKGLD